MTPIEVDSEADDVEVVEPPSTAPATHGTPVMPAAGVSGLRGPVPGANNSSALMESGTAAGAGTGSGAAHGVPVAGPTTARVGGSTTAPCAAAAGGACSPAEADQSPLAKLQRAATRLGQSVPELMAYLRRVKGEGNRAEEKRMSAFIRES